MFGKALLGCAVALAGAAPLAAQEPCLTRTKSWRPRCGR
jgi:hypothetical protein